MTSKEKQADTPRALPTSGGVFINKGGKLVACPKDLKAKAATRKQAEARAQAAADQAKSDNSEG